MTDTIYFPQEIDFKNINISCINYNNNHKYCSITYNNNPLYIQTPTFKFIQPIVHNQLNKRTYDELYLFFNQEDKKTLLFITFINNLEQLILKHLTTTTHKTYTINPIIKTLTLDDTHKNVKYIKFRLINNTIFMHNSSKINVDDLNKLINKVIIQNIIEMNMIWLTDNKFGIYIKPLKTRAIDIEPTVEFRNDDEIDEIMISENLKEENVNESESAKESESIKIENLSRKRKLKKKVSEKSSSDDLTSSSLQIDLSSK